MVVVFDVNTLKLCQYQVSPEFTKVSELWVLIEFPNREVFSGNGSI
jgi:hypothetical protein